jgi:transposase
MTLSRKPYPSDVSDEEWALVAPYLTLLPEEAGQREPPCARCSTAYAPS